MGPGGCAGPIRVGCPLLRRDNAHRNGNRRSGIVSKAAASERAEGHDTMHVQSVAKAFRVLRAFGATQPSLSLTQIAVAAELDRSAAQRFTHTLTALGYLRRDP